MEVAFVGIDLAQNVFQLHDEDADGVMILQRRVRRDRLMAEVEALSPCTIAIEFCIGASYWQRRFETAGHRVRINAPQYVKPFAQHQKMIAMRRCNLSCCETASHEIRSRQRRSSNRTSRRFIADDSGW